MDAAPWNKDDANANFYSSNYKPNKANPGGNGMMDILYQRSPSASGHVNADNFGGKGAGAFSPAPIGNAPFATRVENVEDANLGNQSRIQASLLGDKGNKFSVGAPKVGQVDANTENRMNYATTQAEAYNARMRNRGSGNIFAGPDEA